MANYRRRVCRLEKPCTPMNVRQWIYCAFRHHDEEYADLCKKAEISPRRVERLYREASTGLLEEEFGKMVAATQRFDGLAIFLRAHGLDSTLRIAPVEAGEVREDNIIASVLGVHVADGELSGELRDALKNGHIDADELPKLLERAQKAHERTGNAVEVLASAERRSRRRSRLQAVGA